MTKAQWLTVAAAVSMAVALAGCSNTSAGTPLPDDATTTGSKTESTAERPREIKLDGKDPCALIQQADWSEFDIKAPGRASENPTFKSPNCHYGGAGAVTLVITEGIEVWTEGNRNAEVESAEPIEGFPTITMANNVDKRACYAAVDVADGQYLLTTARPNPDDSSKPEKCDLAYQLAESAMKTLVTL